jgi:hypothetical protein
MADETNVQDPGTDGASTDSAQTSSMPPSPDQGGPTPDVTSNAPQPPASPDQGGPVPQSGGTPQAAAQATADAHQSKWANVVKGALAGLMTGGAIGAAKGALQPQVAQQNLANRQSEQTAKAAGAWADVRFKNVQSAYYAAQTTKDSLVMEHMPQQFQEEAEKSIESEVGLLKSMGWEFQAIPSGPDSFHSWLSAHPEGANMYGPPLAGPRVTYIPLAPGTGLSAKALNFATDLAKATNLPAPDAQGYYTTPPNKRDKYLSSTLNAASGRTATGGDLPPQQVQPKLNEIQKDLDSYKQTANPNPEVVQYLQSTVDRLGAHQNGIDLNNTKQQERQTAVGTTIAKARADSQAAARLATTTDMFQGSLPNGSQIAGSRQELLDAGIQNPTKLPASEAAKVFVARQLVAPDGLFHAVAKDLANLDAKGKTLNIASARINDFLTGKVGNDPDFAPLRTDMKLLSTALMQAHVGLRASAEMMEHFKGLADYSISNNATLRSALAAEYRYVTEKAARPKKATNGPQ